MKKILFISILLILLVSQTGCDLKNFVLGAPKVKDPIACRKHTDCVSDADNFFFCLNPNTTQAKCDVKKCIVAGDCDQVCKEWSVERAGDIMACQGRRVKCKSDNTCLCSCLIRNSNVKNTVDTTTS